MEEREIRELSFGGMGESELGFTRVSCMLMVQTYFLVQSIKEDLEQA
jgi:hypothetical protein